MTTTPDSQPTSTATALEVLKELEWSASDSRGGFGTFAVCPMCEGSKNKGHAPGCRLAQALATDTTAERVMALECIEKLVETYGDATELLGYELGTKSFVLVDARPVDKAHVDLINAIRAALHTDKPAVTSTEGGGNTKDQSRAVAEMEGGG